MNTCYYRGVNNIRCGENCYKNLSYCIKHLLQFKKCPYTSIMGDRKQICCKKTLPNEFFCRAHHNFLIMNRKMVLHKINTSYTHYNSFIDNDKEKIIDELLERTNFYINRGLYPDERHSVWMVYLAGRYEQIISYKY